MRGGISCLFLVNSSVRKWCVLAAPFFISCMDSELGNVGGQNHCGIKGTDLIFVDDTVLAGGHDVGCRPGA